MQNCELFIIYCELLDRINEHLIEKCPMAVNKKGVILQHDNVKLYCARQNLEKINEIGWKILPLPPYSPNFAPSDFHFYIIDSK